MIVPNRYLVLVGIGRAVIGLLVVAGAFSLEKWDLPYMGFRR
jgi:hypothetical protein